MAVNRARTNVHYAGQQDFLAEIARAYYERNLTQEEVAAQFGISRSQVSRYLRRARELEIVQVRIVAPEARETALEAELHERFPQLREVRVAVVFSSRPATVRRAVARFAARLLEQLVEPGLTVAFGAGRTLAATVDLLRKRGVHDVSVVQAMGNAGHEGMEIDYNAIARRAAAAFGGRAYQINAPAILGAGARASDLEASNSGIRDALRRARNASLYVTGIGSMSGDEIYVKTGLISLADLEAVVADGAVGDICGNFFDAAGNPVPGHFADRLVGISLADLRRAPMVVACAAGAEKIPAIHGALQGRLVNALVTDEHTARGVLDLQTERHGQPPAARQESLERVGGAR